MITIYRESWNHNAALSGTMDAEAAFAWLQATGHRVCIVEGECPNPNCGCEADTDEELDAICEIARDEKCSAPPVPR